MSIKTNKIGVAIVGLGVGEQHAKAFSALDGCEIRYLYDLDQAKARQLSGEFIDSGIATSLNEMLEDPEIQIISIASYDDAHAGQVIQALEAGKHVFVEKPLCRTFDELKAIKAVWLKHKGRLKLFSNLVLRTAPVFQWLRNEFQSGSFGLPYAFDGEYLYGRLQKITDGWRGSIKDYSVMLGGGVHLVDLMFWLIGERPVSVYSLGNRVCTQRTSFLREDYVTTLLWFPSGMIGRIASNFGCVHPHQHIVRLFGSQATFISDDQGPRIYKRRDPSVPPEPLLLSALPETKGELIAPFVSAVLNDKSLDEETQNIFDVMSICIACDESVKMNSEVKIQYV